ncbi:MAG TPA: YdeI/OmpD-associated family protein, partial [Bacteroidota bacterium]|nr:YdeI/OmpD-associated family protein [Bacteroidota bacterium]
MNKKEKTRSGSARDRTKSKGEDQGIPFKSVLERSDNKLWNAHVRVPSPVVKRLEQQNSRRVVCSLNGWKPYQTAILPFGNGISIVRVNKKLRHGLGIEFGDTVKVVLKPDTSEYGLPVPEELRVLFLQDEDGSKLFHALTPGKQRTLLYIVDSVKSPEKRISRAVV